MSRIGKKPIEIPTGVEVEMMGREVKIKGPKGEISQEIPSELKLKIEEKKLSLLPVAKTKRSKSLWGLSRALLQNNVRGVKEGYEKKLELKGIGYRASVKDEKNLSLEIGFSHSVNMPIPEGIAAVVEKNIITVSGTDKQKVGETAAKIRKLRPPEPYKGKGIRYLGEKVRIKEGKKTVTGAK